MLKLCTGHYINYYRCEDEHYCHYKNELFIIINEGNGDATYPLDMSKLHAAEKICTDYIDKNGITPNLQKELESALCDIFEYGVQVLLVEKDIFDLQTIVNTTDPEKISYKSRLSAYVNEIEKIAAQLTMRQSDSFSRILRICDAMKEELTVSKKMDEKG